VGRIKRLNGRKQAKNIETKNKEFLDNFTKKRPSSEDKTKIIAQKTIERNCKKFFVFVM
jgi:hypothetical protein